MIFKTITDDITGANKSIGLFGLSLKDVSEKLYDIQTRGLKDTLFNTPTIEFDEKAIALYNQKIEDGASAQNALATASKNTNSATIALMESANGTTISTEQMTTAQKASTVAARAQSAAYKAVSIAANMIVYTLIAKGIQLAADAIDHYVNRAKYAAEAIEEAQQKIDETQSNLKTMNSIIKENKDRFLQLSTGVSEFSENLRLSEEDYAEYLSISQKLAEIAPSLIAGYDEQGNALLNIGNNAEETEQKLNNLIETQQKISRQTLSDNLDVVAKGVYYEVEEAKGIITQLNQELATTKQEASEISFDIADTVKNGNGIFQFTDLNDPLRTYRNTFIKALESANIGWEDLGNDQIWVKDFSGAANNGGRNSNEVREIALKEAQEYYNLMLNLENNVHSASIAGLEKEITDKEKLIEVSYSKMTANLQAWVAQNYGYQYLSDKSQRIVDALIPNINWNSLNIPLLSGQDYQNYINENILMPLMSVQPENKAEVEKLFSDLLSFENGDLNILPFAEQLQARLKQLGITIDITPIILDEQQAKDKLQNSIETIANGTDYRTASGNQVDAENLKTLEDYTKGFTTAQVELWNKVTLDAKNAADAIQKYEKALSSENLVSKWEISAEQSQAINNYTSRLTTLHEILEKIASGTLTETDKLDYFKEFPELANETDNLTAAIQRLVLSEQASALALFNDAPESYLQSIKEAATETAYFTDAEKQLLSDLSASMATEMDKAVVAQYEATRGILEAAKTRISTYGAEMNMIQTLGAEMGNMYSRYQGMSLDDILSTTQGREDFASEFGQDALTTYDRY